MNNRNGKIVRSMSNEVGGGYTTSGMQSGHYCVEVVDERELGAGQLRYQRTYFNIKILGNTTIGSQNASVSTELNAKQLRIVLEWGSSPRDLDSHLVGPRTAGGNFHIFYSAKRYMEGNKLIADLDLDDTSCYGPETTTIYEPVEGIYTFYVFNWSGTPSITKSGASVQVYGGDDNEPIYSFNVPTVGSGGYWSVFSYNSKTGEITPINRIDYSVVYK